MVTTIREFTNEDVETPIKYVLGIDPGTGSRSACGVALLDLDAGAVLWTAELYPRDGRAQPGMPVHHRIKLINEQVQELFAQAEDFASDSDSRVIVGIESFVMRGKGGETLAQFKGAVMSGLPLKTEIKEVQNTTIKKYAGDTGKADKMQVGKGLIERLPVSAGYIQNLMDNRKWDEIDAIAIAWTVKEVNKL